MENGIDVFDSSSADSATSRGHALAYNIGSEIYTLQQKKDTLKEKKDTLKQFQDEPATTEGFIDLNNTLYASDFHPLVSGCGCYTCVTYTRAYIHHLLVTKELLAGILLTV